MLESLLRFAKETFRRIDAVVNAGGLLPSRREFGVVDAPDDTLGRHVGSVGHGISAALPTMKGQGFGHLIHVAQVKSRRLAPTADVHSATKFVAQQSSDGRRQGAASVRMTVISPSVPDDELGRMIAERSDTVIRSPAIDAVARAILYAIDQAENIHMSEVVVRPRIDGRSPPGR